MDTIHNIQPCSLPFQARKRFDYGAVDHVLRLQERLLQARHRRDPLHALQQTQWVWATLSYSFPPSCRDVNDGVMELLVTAYACKTSTAREHLLALVAHFHLKVLIKVLVDKIFNYMWLFPTVPSMDFHFYLREQVKESQVLFFLILIQRMLTSILRLRVLKVFKAKMFRMKI